MASTRDRCKRAWPVPRASSRTSPTMTKKARGKPDCFVAFAPRNDGCSEISASSRAQAKRSSVFVTAKAAPGACWYPCYRSWLWIPGLILRIVPNDNPLDSISRAPSDLPVVPKCRRRTALISGANQRHFRRRPVPLKRGVSRSSRTLGVGCDGRDGTADERCHCGRRSRVVLTSRR